MFVIYKATNLKNEKMYIGFTSSWPGRKKRHLKLSKNNSNSYFHKAIRKYGWENFEWEVLYRSNDLDFTKNIMEGYFIRTFDTYNKGYNQTLGGEGTLGLIPPNKGIARTEQQKEYQSHIMKGRSPPNKGKKMSEIQREKLKEIKKTKEWKEKLSEKNRKIWDVFLPTGEVICVNNMKQYCVDNNLCYNKMKKINQGKLKNLNGIICKIRGTD